MDQILKEQLASRFHQDRSDEVYEEIIDRVMKREVAPHQAIRELLEGGG